MVAPLTDMFFVGLFSGSALVDVAGSYHRHVFACWVQQSVVFSGLSIHKLEHHQSDTRKKGKLPTLALPNLWDQQVCTCLLSDCLNMSICGLHSGQVVDSICLVPVLETLTLLQANFQHSFRASRDLFTGERDPSRTD